VAERVATKIELVRFRAGRHVRLQRAIFFAGQWQCERLDDMSRDIVLYLEDIAERYLRGVRPQNRPGFGGDQLRGDPELPSGSKQSTAHEEIDIGLLRDRPQIVRVRDQPCAGQGRAEHQRLKHCQRVGNRVSQTVGQEIDLGICSQQPEGQHDDSRHGARRHS
jgi:hypothetical protein